MLSTIPKKAKKAAWLATLRIVGAVHPRTGTRLAAHIYSSWGMHIAGPPSFIAADVWFDGTRDYDLITVGEGCTISREVRVLTHDWSPHAALRSMGRSDTRPVGRVSPVTIGPNVFIGMGAIVLPGSDIGEGAIVGAGTVVRGKVSPFTIVAGNPMTSAGTTHAFLSRNYPSEYESLGVDAQPPYTG